MPKQGEQGKGYEATAQGFFAQLKDLEKEKKYAEMAALMQEAQLVYDMSNPNAEKNYMKEGFELFCEDLADLKGAKEVSQEKRDTVIGLSRAFKRTLVDAQINLSGQIEAWERKIAAGEVEELAIFKNDKDMVRRLANDIVAYQTESGATMSAIAQLEPAIMSYLVAGDGTWRDVLLKDKDVVIIAQKTDESDYVKNVILREQKKVPYEKALEITTKYAVTENKLNRTDIQIDKNYIMGPDQKPKFTFPEYVKQLNAAKTEKDLFDQMIPHKENIENAKTYSKDALEVGRLAAECWEVVRTNVFQGLKNDTYNELKESLKKAATIGNGFTVTTGTGKEVEINDVQSRFMAEVVQKLDDTAGAYLEQLNGLDEDAKQVEQVARILKAVSKLKNQVSKRNTRMKEIQPSIADTSLEQYIKDEQKQIDIVMTAASVKEISTENFPEMEQDYKLKKKADKLTETIREAEAAQVGVHGGSSEYDEALEAVKKLNVKMEAYLAGKMVGSNEEFYRSCIDEMNQAKEEAVKKIEAYEKRRAGKSESSNRKEKTKRRIDVMERAMKEVSAIGKNLDTINMEMEKKEIAKVNANLLQKDIEKMDTRSDYYKSAALYEGYDSPMKPAMISAGEGMTKIKDFIEQGKAFSPENQAEMRKAIAAVTVAELGLVDGKKQLSKEDYSRKINELAEEPDFVKATKKYMNAERLRDFATDAEAGAHKVMENFFEEKNKAIEESQKKMQKQKEAAPEKGLH